MYLYLPKVAHTSDPYESRLILNMSSQRQTDKTPHRGQHFKKAYGGF